MNYAPPPARTRNWPLILVVSFVGVAVLGVLAAAGGDGLRYWSDKRGMIQKCQREIDNQLTSPGSAEYHWNFERESGQPYGIEGTVYRATGYVDSENGFGALVRGDIRCGGAPSRVGHFEFWGADYEPR